MKLTMECIAFEIRLARMYVLLFKKNYRTNVHTDSGKNIETQDRRMEDCIKSPTQKLPSTVPVIKRDQSTRMPFWLFAVNNASLYLIDRKLRCRTQLFISVHSIHSNRKSETDKAKARRKSTDVLSKKLHSMGNVTVEESG